ncbi:GNAT family N-acetyltransferase [Arenimonas malthae]|uniref:GNAT family N-acetyltransferase n=1 Tax=Arenimonas malthae TaxID=354197 RepID=UPI0009FFE4D2|nr:GNAT family protein [Arenimonas malthae]
MQLDESKIYDDGGRIYLRLLRESDIGDQYESWFRDELVTEFLDSKRITRQDAIEHLRAGRESNSYFMLAVMHKADSRHIGNVKLGPIQWRHSVSDLSTVIGDRRYWGVGLATEAVSVGTRIAFDTLNLRKLSAGIVHQNVGSIKAYTRAGWVVEGRLRGHHLINGEPQDRIVVSCFNPAFFSDPVPSQQL